MMDLQMPTFDANFMQHRFITIEGNIGAGKTTLAHLLAKRLNARLILEEFADNPFLPKFYENPKQYAFPLELFFMAERFKQQKDMLFQTDLFQSITVSDYLFTNVSCLQGSIYRKKNLSFIKSCSILCSSNLCFRMCSFTCTVL